MTHNFFPERILFILLFTETDTTYLQTILHILNLNVRTQTYYFFIMFLSVTFNNSLATSSLEPASRESKGHLFWKWHWILAFEWTNYKRCVCCSKRGPLLIDSFCYVIISYVFIMVSWMDTSFKNSVLFQQKKSSISQVYDKSNQKKSGKSSNWIFYFFFKKKKL